MGILDLLFGSEQEEPTPKKTADTTPARATEAQKPATGEPRSGEPRRADHPPGRPTGASHEAGGTPSPPVGGASGSQAEGGRVVRIPQDIQVIAAAVTQHVERTAAAFEQVLEGLQTLTGMVQATAKSLSKSDQERKQQSLELRAHFTSETDRLISSIREDVTREASLELFRALVPALDEVDHVMRESQAGAEVRAESIRIVRRRLRDAFSRLGIEEIPVESKVTAFDAELHEGRPFEGEPDAVAGVAPNTIVDVERNGWTGFGKVIRHALVTVVRE